VEHIESITYSILIFLVISIVIGQFCISSAQKKCRHDEITVVYNLKNNKITRITREKVYVSPFTQSHYFLPLMPIMRSVNLQNIPASDGVLVTMHSIFTFGIELNEKMLFRAAEKFMNRNIKIISKTGDIIIRNQLIKIINAIPSQDIRQTSKRFQEILSTHINVKLNEYGMNLSDMKIHAISFIQPQNFNPNM